MTELMSESVFLKTLCDQVVSDPSLESKEGKTFCNIGVDKICSHFGYYFRDKQDDPNTVWLADQIYDWMMENWKKVDDETACNLANDGLIVIAAHRDIPHGHVTVLYPGLPVWSSKWCKECPAVVNIGMPEGKRNEICGANWAFKDEPLYFTDPININNQ